MTTRRFLLLVPVFSLGCGGASTAPKEPAAPATESAPLASAPDQKENEKAPEPKPEAPAPEPEKKDEPREVKYVVAPEGLRIEVSGATFKPKAKAIRVGGGWGVRVTVEASSSDAVLSLLSTKNGPLAFASKITAPQTLGPMAGEKRVGEEEMFLTPGEPVTLKRDWPPKGATPLKAGQTLELQVGLWGLGEQSETRRPVMKFFVIKMVAGKKTPQPVVSPPASAEQ